MKLTPFKVKNFLAKPDSLSGVLVYGSDGNRIDFYIKEITAKLDDYFTQVMDFTVINKSPGLLLSELAHISLFNSKKLIKLVNVSGNISKELIIMLNSDIGNNYIVIAAGELPYSSTLRSYIENSDSFGAIACYKNTNNSIQDIILNYFKERSIQYTGEVIFYLENYFNYSKSSVYRELEKIALYLGDRKDLRYSDMQACLSVSSSDYVTLDNLCCTLINRDMTKFIRISEALILQENFSPIALIRIIMNYFARLETVLLFIQSGMNEETATAHLSPPLFFNQIHSFKRHLQLLKLPVVKKVLTKLINLEIMCKKINLDQKMILHQTAYEICLE